MIQTTKVRVECIDIAQSQAGFPKDIDRILDQAAAFEAWIGNNAAMCDIRLDCLKLAVCLDVDSHETDAILERATTIVNWVTSERASLPNAAPPLSAGLPSVAVPGLRATV